MKTLELNGREILAVEVPDDVNELNVFNLTPDPHIEWCDDLRNFDVILLPSGQWQILGRPSDISEEVAMGVVEIWEDSDEEGSWTIFKDYENDELDIRTATESLLSWCRANGIENELLIIKNK